MSHGHRLKGPTPVHRVRIPNQRRNLAGHRPMNLSARTLIGPKPPEDRCHLAAHPLAYDERRFPPSSRRSRSEPGLIRAKRWNRIDKRALSS